MSSPAMSPFERIGRAEKVAKLVRAIDRTALSIGMDPIRAAIEVAQRLRANGPEFWVELAKFAECNEPSSITQREVIGVYLARAADNRRRSS